MDVGVFDKFKKITGYDIQLFMGEFVVFCQRYYPIVVQYYGGQPVSAGRAFELLEALLKKSKDIEALFELKYNEMNTIDFTELLDVFTDCQTELWTIKNSAKWLRSAVIGSYGDNVALERTLRSRENFESMADSINIDEPDDNWQAVPIKNLIEEEDYTPDDGSPMFKFNLKDSGVYDIENIVDSLTVKNILGKDIAKKFEFVNNDFELVQFDAAVEQALDTIIGSIKGTIPEFPEYGFQDMVGVSVNALSYPTIFKNMIDMFNRDGRWKEVQLLDLYREDDCVFCKISAKTVTNNYLVTNIQI